MSLDDVIARLEGASEGSRELDAAVEIAAGGLRDSEVLILAKGGDVVILRRTIPPYITLATDFPRYTTSLDVALTLLPEGMSADLHIGPRSMANDAIVYEPKKSTDEQRRRVTTFHPHEARAAREGKLHWNTPALALCIACLRAKAAST